MPPDLCVLCGTSESMLDQYTESTKGPGGEPGVVIAHVEANVHLHRTLTKIREAGGSPSVALNLSLIHISEPTRPY